MESQTTLATAAEVTNRAQLGALACAIGYRNPNLIAGMARTIDYISAGRFILGLGSGWKIEDCEEDGYGCKRDPDRLRDLKAAMPVIKHRPALVDPLPVQEKLPIIIGVGGGRVTLEIVAEHSDIWNGSGSPDEIANNCSTLDENCKTIGRDPSEIERTVPGINVANIVEIADVYLAKGITAIITGSNAPGPGMQRIRDLVAWPGGR